jgi:hypothetical protein
MIAVEMIRSMRGIVMGVRLEPGVVPPRLSRGPQSFRNRSSVSFTTSAASMATI